MKKDNPYTSSKVREVNREQPALLKSRDIFAVFVCSVAGGVVGFGIGSALGFFLPSYYRSVFPDGDSPNFDPLAVGIGHGLTQGIALGTVVGLVLLIGRYWFEFQKWKQTTSQQDR